MSACPELTTDVTDEEAYAILEPYFVTAQEVFVEGLRRLGLPTAKVEKVRLDIDSAMHDTPRHFAGCETSGRVIHVAAEMVELTDGIVAGVFLHELGHATDFLLPARFRLRDDRLEILPAYKNESDDPQGPEVLALRTASNWMRQWERRNADDVEITADKIAEMVSGRTIGYRGPCLLQHLGQGDPRPRGLR